MGFLGDAFCNDNLNVRDSGVEQWPVIINVPLQASTLRLFLNWEQADDLSRQLEHVLEAHQHDVEDQNIADGDL